MAQQLLIDATHPEETRVAVVDDGKVKEFEYESTNKQQIAGNIYLARIVRVEPSLQAVFVEYGGNRHGFLAFSEVHPHYYNIPVGDQQPVGEAPRRPAVDENPDGLATDPRGADPSGPAALATDQDISSLDVVDAADPSESDELLVDEDAAAGIEIDTQPCSAAGGDDNDDGPDENSAVESSEMLQDSANVAEVREEIKRHRGPQRRYRVQEVIRQRQLVLVQILKDERGNKGAALTTYISLAGRYCVLMPNTDRGGGISRKITNVTDRRKLKKIVADIEVPEGVGLIIRTAGANRTKQEIKRDYEYLIRQWDQIRDLTFNSTAPALIYEDGGLIKRTIRDDYGKGIEEVVVEGDEGYKSAKAFMKMIMPSHAKRVKKYTGQIPLFASHGIEQFLSQLFDPVVPLPSGGYIVIGTTEALVAIDVNSGKATSQGTLEQTALQTNLEAAEIVANQLRLRDLAGLIVIDFIDMDDGKHNAAVEKCLKDSLKPDRSKLQTGRITSFGLLEMSRQRLRPGLQELTSQPCTLCNGSGLVRAEDSVALEVLRQIEMNAASGSDGNVVASVPVAVANIILNKKRRTLMQIEATHSVSVAVEANPGLSGADMEIKRVVAQILDSGETRETVVSIESTVRPQDGKAGSDQGDESPRRRRKRPSRGAGGRAGKPQRAGGEPRSVAVPESSEEQPEAAASHRAEDQGAAPKERKGRKSRRRSSGKKNRAVKQIEAEAPAAASPDSETAPSAAVADTTDAAPAETTEKPRSPRRRRRSPDRPKSMPADDGSARSAAGETEQQEGNARRSSDNGTPISDRSNSGANGQPGDAATATAPTETGQPRRVGWWSPEYRNR